eukprot:COSAG01_NODE_10855_length_2067_cov_25.166667_2_plen_313_part_00
MTALISPAQVQFYQNEGYLVVDDVLPLELVEELLVVLEGGGDGGEPLYGIDMTTRHPAFLELARDPRITDRIACLLGPDITLQHSKTVHKNPGQPGGGAVRFHQDFAYFPHTNTDVLAVMVVLDDFTEENACMRVVSGSHKLGLLDHNNGPDGLFNAEPSLARHQHLWADDGALPKLCPRAGGLSIHHALTLHGSPENCSGLRRRGLVFQYRAADSYQLADNLWADGGLLVRGRRSSTVRCEQQGALVLPRFAPSAPPPGHTSAASASRLSARGRHGTLWNQESDWAQARNSEFECEAAHQARSSRAVGSKL